jgi:hypothetical protein
MATGKADLLTGGSGQAATENIDGIPQECMTLFLTELQSSSAQWILKVYCQLEAGDCRAHVATVITTPLNRSIAAGANEPDDARPATRAIARFSMPGARQWFVEGRLLKVYLDEEEETAPPMSKATIYIDASRGNGGQAVELLEGIVVPKQNYETRSGLTDEAVEVPQGAVIQQVSFSANGDGTAACVVIDPTSGLNVNAQVAAGQAHTFVPAQCLNWLAPLRIEFQGNVASYFVAWVV